MLMSPTNRTDSGNYHPALQYSARSLKTLSGGEQAFSALSFSLAMWPFSASPLRAMDEFDKNMDQTFLNVSIRLLLEAAETATNRQLLILTPNDYHGCLSSPQCEALVTRLTQQDDRNIKFLHMPEVDR